MTECKLDCPEAMARLSDERELILIWRIEFLGDIIAQLPHGKGCSIVYRNGVCDCPKSKVNQELTASSFAGLKRNGAVNSTR
jgi:hypothetical protein